MKTSLFSYNKMNVFEIFFSCKVPMRALMSNTRSSCWGRFWKVWTTYIPGESCTETWRWAASTHFTPIAVNQELQRRIIKQVTIKAPLSSSFGGNVQILPVVEYKVINPGRQDGPQLLSPSAVVFEVNKTLANVLQPPRLPNELP